jgi:hypothetical protein
MESETVMISAKTPFRSVMVTAGTVTVLTVSVPCLRVNEVPLSDRPSTLSLYLILSEVIRSVKSGPTAVLYREATCWYHSLPDLMRLISSRSCLKRTSVDCETSEGGAAGLCFGHHHQGPDGCEPMKYHAVSE